MRCRFERHGEPTETLADALNANTTKSNGRTFDGERASGVRDGVARLVSYPQILRRRPIKNCSRGTSPDPRILREHTRSPVNRPAPDERACGL
jgi:hypothetical protein